MGEVQYFSITLQVLYIPPNISITFKTTYVPIRLVYFQSNVISVTGVIGEVNVYDKRNMKRQLTKDQESIILKHRVNVSHIGKRVTNQGFGKPIS